MALSNSALVLHTFCTLHHMQHVADIAQHCMSGKAVPFPQTFANTVPGSNKLQLEAFEITQGTLQRQEIAQTR